MMMMMVLAMQLALAATAAAATMTTATAAPPPAARRQGQPLHIVFYSFLGRSHMTPYLEALELVAARGSSTTTTTTTTNHAVRVTVVTDATAADTWLRKAYPHLANSLRTDVPHEIEDYMHTHRARIMSAMADPANRAEGFSLILKQFTLPTYEAQVRHVRAVLQADDGDGAEGDGSSNGAASSHSGGRHNGRPDLLLCDALLDACMDVAAQLDVPYALTMSGVMPGWSDAPYLASWFCMHGGGATTESMTLSQRLQCKVFDPARALWRARGAISQLGALRRELGLHKAAAAGSPGARDRGALKFVNTFFGFETPRPLDPLVQLVGPVKTHANSTLPADIDAWLGGKKRVVLAAFGTHVDLPERVLDGLMTALLSALDDRLADGVVWAISNIRRDKFPSKLDPRVLLLPFAPQKALLNDARVAAFVSHGGAESSHEAMMGGKPILVVPFFGDQPLNALKIADAGNGVALPQHELTAERARAALERLLSPATRGAFVAAAARMQAVAVTRSRRAVEQTADDLELFARFGWRHLIPADRRMGWAKANDADLYVVVAATFVLVVALIVASARLAWQRLMRGSRRAAAAAADEPLQPQPAAASAAAAWMVVDDCICECTCGARGSGGGVDSDAAARDQQQPQHGRRQQHAFNLTADSAASLDRLVAAAGGGATIAKRRPRKGE